jgi:hypothetical protein
MARFAGLLIATMLLLGSAMLVSAGAADPPPNTTSAPAASPVPPGGVHSGSLYPLHATAGLNCASCHKESPPTTPVATATCLSCHGGYADLAKKTDDRGPANPHASHQGELPCDSCHHAHQASVDFCAQCHQWGFKVP